MTFAVFKVDMDAENAIVVLHTVMPTVIHLYIIKLKSLAKVMRGRDLVLITDLDNSLISVLWLGEETNDCIQ